jgi:hypothetical protein
MYTQSTARGSTVPMQGAFRVNGMKYVINNFPCISKPQQSHSTWLHGPMQGAFGIWARGEGE